MKRKIISFLATIVGLCMLAYPFVSEYLASRNNNQVIANYNKSLQENDYEAILKRAYEYNKSIIQVQTTLTDPFMPFKDRQDLEQEQEYLSQLNADGSGVMGVVDIPEIDTKLPIYHGTSAKVLEQGAGHLEGSSLPVGGKTTHSVITGHTGLTNQKLFTDLPSLKKGDKFFLYVYGKNMAYQVDSIDVILPEDISKLIISEGQDYVTLVTCTPYGINTHRLLVRGHRVPFKQSDVDKAKKDKRGSLWMQTYKRAVIIGIIILLIFFITKKLIETIRKPAKEE